MISRRKEVLLRRFVAKRGEKGFPKGFPVFPKGCYAACANLARAGPPSRPRIRQTKTHVTRAWLVRGQLFCLRFFFFRGLLPVPRFCTAPFPFSLVALFLSACHSIARRAVRCGCVGEAPITLLALPRSTGRSTGRRATRPRFALDLQCLSFVSSAASQYSTEVFVFFFLALLNPRLKTIKYMHPTG